MKNIHEWDNYVNGAEYDNKLVLYAGKTRQGRSRRQQGRCAYGKYYGGLSGGIFENIHSYAGGRNDKFTEQLHINTVRLVAQMLPDVVVCGNTNDDAHYGPIVNGYSQTVLDKIVKWIQGSRLMTERKMAATKRKLARKVLQAKRARAAAKTAA